MPTAWLSTLKNLSDTLNLDPTEVARRFPEILTDPDHDAPVSLSAENKNWIDAACANLRYPRCSSCQTSVLLCHCEQQDNYQPLQTEHQTLLHDMEATELAIQALIDTPFRQSRNAFGFTAAIFGGMNLVLANVAISTAALWIALLVPSLALGGYVYIRGRREEGKSNDDMQADWLDKKINLLCKERDAIELRLKQQITTAYEHQAKPKLPKEKRDIPGNSLSHFLGSSISTASITFTVIKYGALPTLIPVGSTLCWALTGGLGGTVGLYFAYKRYSHLSCKVNTESCMALLVTHEADLHRFISQLKALNPAQPNLSSSQAIIQQSLSRHPQSAPVTTLTTPLLDIHVDTLMPADNLSITDLNTSYQPPRPH